MIQHTNSTLLDTLEPWQVLLMRIVGRAAKDYTDSEIPAADKRSAAVFFWHAKVSKRRIQQAAFVHDALIASEDEQDYAAA